MYSIKCPEWRSIITSKKPGEGFTEEEVEMSSDWRNCLVGEFLGLGKYKSDSDAYEQAMRIGLSIGSDYLYLGSRFTKAISSNNISEVKLIYTELTGEVLP
jgi:hypothetical protein